MSSNVLLPKRKRTSKKTKKSWRKNCDIQDVENFLQDERVQEATGGLASNKTDDQLYYVDKKTVSNADDTKPDRRRLPKQLKCHAALIPDPLIVPARTSYNEKRDKVKTSASRQSRRQSGSRALKRTTILQQDGKPQDTAVTGPVFDLWGSQDITKPDENLDEHYMAICKKKRTKPPSYHLSKPSEIPAVEIPVPGTSYKPTEKDHKELLRKAIAVEKKKIREEQRIKRALDEKFPTAADAPNEHTWLQEWESSGLLDDEEHEGPGTTEMIVENDESQTVKLSNNPPVRRENKKTEKERRKLKEAKLIDRKAVQKKVARAREHGTLRLKSLKKEVMREEMAVAARLARKQLKKEQTKGIVTRKLGRFKYEEPNLELKLSGELPSSLRLLKPEGNLMVDRFKSLQKRNIIEPRQRAKVVLKYKPKAFEKKSHRTT